MRKEPDIKAPDGYLLGGLRRVRKDGSVLFQRGWWQAPIEWAGQEIWVHEASPIFVKTCEWTEAAPPGMDIYEARRRGLSVELERTKRPDAKPAYRRPDHKAWATRQTT